jgi:hypothetical protein
MKKATWVNGKRTVTGEWEYYWPGDKFFIRLDTKDRITGDYKRITVVGGEHPEWGNWKIKEVTDDHKSIPTNSRHLQEMSYHRIH